MVNEVWARKRKRKYAKIVETLEKYSVFGDQSSLEISAILVNIYRRDDVNDFIPLTANKNMVFLEMN